MKNLQYIQNFIGYFAILFKFFYNSIELLQNLGENVYNFGNMNL